VKATDFRRTVNIPDARRRTILDGVGSMSPGGSDDAGAPDASAHLRDTDIGVAITQSGGRTALFAVPARATGPHTLCFLHSGFLHAGTKCEIFALRESAPVSMASGEVRWVQHVDGGIHAVGLRFDTAIDPQSLISESAARRPGRGAALSDIHGRVLILDDQRVDAELARMHLRTLGLDVAVASDTTTAIAAIDAAPPDVLVCDLNLGNGMPGEAAMKVLARRGFSGPVVILTGDDDESRLRSVRDAGAFAVVLKPYDRKDLLVAVTSALVKAGTIRIRTPARASASDAPGQPGNHEPIRSSLPWSQDTLSLVTMYIEQTRALADSLAGALDADDRDAIRRACMTLKGTGTGYGFDALSEAGVRALEGLTPAAPANALPGAIHEIRALVARLAPPEKAA
jgi:CheY-like chemotaxis protein